jgi:uroporphyrin-III C-methyltransferase/precorrin-2 dehydrogenase/sirohydrochlorin ferrochelatase
MLFPLFLRLGGRLVVVVGGGTVGERKVSELLEAGAHVRVVAPEATPAVVAHAQAGRLEHRARAFLDADLDGAWLVIAATGKPEVNAHVARAAEARRLFVNAVDDPEHASALFASILRRPPFTIAISSDGELPGLSRLYREILELALPLERHVERARELRRRWRAEGTPMASRFEELVAALAGSRGQ